MENQRGLLFAAAVYTLSPLPSFPAKSKLTVTVRPANFPVGGHSCQPPAPRPTIEDNSSPFRTRFCRTRSFIGTTTTGSSLVHCKLYWVPARAALRLGSDARKQVCCRLVGCTRTSNDRTLTARQTLQRALPHRLLGRWRPREGPPTTRATAMPEPCRVQGDAGPETSAVDGGGFQVSLSEVRLHAISLATADISPNEQARSPIRKGGRRSVDEEEWRVRWDRLSMGRCPRCPRMLGVGRISPRRACVLERDRQANAVGAGWMPRVHGGTDSSSAIYSDSHSHRASRNRKSNVNATLPNPPQLHSQPSFELNCQSTNINRTPQIHPKSLTPISIAPTRAPARGPFVCYLGTWL